MRQRICLRRIIIFTKLLRLVKGAEINLSNLTAPYGPLLLTKTSSLINLIETDLKRWQEIVGELAKANSKVAKNGLKCTKKGYSN